MDPLDTAIEMSGSSTEEHYQGMKKSTLKKVNDNTYFTEKYLKSY